MGTYRLVASVVAVNQGGFTGNTTLITGLVGNGAGGAFVEVGSIPQSGALLRYDTKFYLDGSGSSTDINALPAGFTPTSAGVYLHGVTFNATNPQVVLQFDELVTGPAIPDFVNHPTDPTYGVFFYPENVPSALVLFLAGIGIQINHGALNGTYEFVTLEIDGNYVTKTYKWYYNQLTGHYQYATVAPGSPWVLGAPNLTITGVNPDTSGACPTVPGGIVTISGTGFADGAIVRFGGVQAKDVTVVNSTTITCRPPLHSAATVDIVVDNPDFGEATLSSSFTYAASVWYALLQTLTLSPEVEATLETYVEQACAPTPAWGIYGASAPTLAWWWYQPLNWYAYQVDAPGTGWVSAAAPVDTNGWYVSAAEWGGSVSLITQGRPEDPRAWSDIAAFATSGSGMLGGSPAGSCNFENHMVYPATGYSTFPPIRIFDGSFDRQLCVLPPTTANATPIAVMSMLSANGTIYLSSFDSGTDHTSWAGRVFSLDIDSGILVPLGDQPFISGHMPYALAWHMGRLWCGTNLGNGSPGKVYWIRPGIDTTWTLDLDLTSLSLGGVDSLQSYGGQLYVGTDAPAGTFAQILVRSTAGAYTTADTGAGGTARVNNGFVAMAVFNGDLYASYWNKDTTAIAYIRQYNGTSWSTVFTGATSTLRPFNLMFVDNGQLFVTSGSSGMGSLSGAILSSPDGVTWTNLTAYIPDSGETLTTIYGIEIL